MNREPVSYSLYYGLDANDHENWTLIGVYDNQPSAVKIIEAWINVYRVKIVYLFPNGITEFRIIEGGKGYFVSSPTAPAPTPPPAPEPAPAPAPAADPSLDFSVVENSMYHPTI